MTLQRITYHFIDCDVTFYTEIVNKQKMYRVVADGNTHIMQSTWDYSSRFKPSQMSAGMFRKQHLKAIAEALKETK